jgi:hypothetical protein
MLYQSDASPGIYYYDGGWSFIGSYVAGTGITLTSGSFSLSTPVTVANGGTGATSFTAGRILFGNGTSAINANVNLFWDNANSRLGIGTSAPATTLDVNGTTQIGNNGTTITEIIRATSNQDFANIGAGNSRTVTFAVTNAATGSSVNITPETAFPDGVIIAYARVSAAGTVEAKIMNTSGSAYNPPAMDYYITIFR